MVNAIKLLKFVYRGLLTGMPILTYNPITKNNFLAPMNVNEYSTYVNIKLDTKQSFEIQNYIDTFTDNLSLTKVSIDGNEKASNYLSLNIYNCTSPVFLNDNPITRFEINTYVTDKFGNYGTLILDYLSNGLSMDPVNIFKKSNDIQIIKKETLIDINCNSTEENINLNLKFLHSKNKDFKANDQLIDFTDKIYYKNGIYDKIYYDTSLTKAVTKSPTITSNFLFNYLGMNFTSYDSIFYFKDNIDLVGKMWSNLYDF